MTVTSSNASGLVVSDILPPYVSFRGFDSSNFAPGTFNPTTGILQWVLPSPLASGVYQLKYQTTVDGFVPGNQVILNHAQMGGTGTQTVAASAAVTVLGAFTVHINVYNEAGEVVRTILVQQYSEPINSMTLSQSNTITSLHGPGSTIEIYYNGVLISSWDGLNNAGQPVSNGGYRIQIDNMGQSGVVTSVSQPAIVSRNLANIVVNVFNSAGEEVRSLYHLVDNPVGSSMSNVSLSSNIIRPTGASSAAASVVNGTITNLAAIYIQTSQNPVTLIWDGTNNGGTVVSPGVYTVNVHWYDGSGQTTDISRDIVVEAGYSVNGVVLAEPNTLNSAHGFSTNFDARGVQNAYAIKVRLFTISGQWIQTLISLSGDPEVSWNAAGMASGIYIAVVDVDNSTGGLVGRQKLKVLLVH